MKPAARTPRRPKSSGVAALELALSLVFLVPLLMGMLQFGYYFYIASHAEEAARAGAREAVMKGGTCAAGGALIIAEGQAPPGAGTGNACIQNGGGAAACYMNEPPLNLGGVGSTTVTLECFNLATLPPNNVTVDPTWRITVQVDFQAALGAFKSLLPAGTGGKVRYTATVTSSP
jgi:hypothetical protein